MRVQLGELTRSGIRSTLGRTQANWVMYRVLAVCDVGINQVEENSQSNEA